MKSGKIICKRGELETLRTMQRTLLPVQLREFLPALRLVRQRFAVYRDYTNEHLCSFANGRLEHSRSGLGSAMVTNQF